MFLKRQIYCKPLEEGTDLGGSDSPESSFGGSELPYNPSDGIDLSGSFPKTANPGESSNEPRQPVPAKLPGVGGTPSAPQAPLEVAPSGQLPDASTAAAPKSWSADMHSKFATLDPAVQTYIHNREKQALDGLMGYKTQVDKFQGIFKPYEALLKQNNLDPYAVTANLAKSHQMLATGPIEQRVAHAVKLLTQYGIGPEALFEGYQAPAGATPAAPAKVELPPEILQRLDTTERIVQDRLRSEAKTELDAFTKNPDNKYYIELQDDIAELLSNGAATTLPDAYEIAKWRNPTVRAKALQELQDAQVATAKAAADKAKSKSRLTLTSSAMPGKPPKGTLADTMRGIVDKHYAN